MKYKLTLLILAILLTSGVAYASPTIRAMSEPGGCGLSVLDGAKLLAFVDADETQDLEKPNPLKINLGNGVIVLPPKSGNKGYPEKSGVETLNIYEGGDIHVELSLKSTGSCGGEAANADENCESISYTGMMTVKNAQGVTQNKVTADSGCGE